MPRAVPYTTAVFDIETDPFLHEREPRPFCCGFKTAETYLHWWGDDCLEQFHNWLIAQKIRYRIYAHNGGKFDFVYFLRANKLGREPFIIKGRIVKSTMARHELRDSYSIIPIALDDYQKDKRFKKTNYAEFERAKRNDFKGEILKYLKSDCENLFQLVTAFRERFNNELTIGSTAIKQLRAIHPFERRKRAFDEKIRPFYFGGRVECLTDQAHTKAKKIHVYDVNSMYPAVMSVAPHPIGDMMEVWHDCERYIKKDGTCKGAKIYFAIIECDSKGALPMRTKTGLSFPHGHNFFMACSHEIITGIELGLITNIKYHRLYLFPQSINFKKFVEIFSAEKIKAKELGNKIDEIFSKLMLNSAYGKFGQNPDNFYKYYIVDARDDKPEGCQLFADYGEFDIWAEPTPKDVFYDVSIAASITSAARAVLLRAIASAKNPLYCDTDSIVCEGINAKIDNSELGAWKLEATGDEFFLAGKKLYALYKKGKPLVDKNNNEYIASKGVRLNAEQIREVALGGEIIFKFDAPTFKLTGKTEFTVRRIKSRLLQDLLKLAPPVTYDLPTIE
jgi:hypothetical protein